MTTTITVDTDTIFINNIPLEELLYRVYQKGKQDTLIDNVNERVTLQQLSKELAEKGRKISVQTLTRKAREAKVKVFAYDGKQNAILRKDIKLFISI